MINDNLKSDTAMDMKYIGEFKFPKNSEIHTGSGTFLIFVNQWGGVDVGGCALATLTGYDTGSAVHKIVGGSYFVNNLTFSPNAACDGIKIASTIPGNPIFAIYIYKVAYNY